MSEICEVCNHKSLTSLFEKDSYHYEKCPNCGLIRIHPQPTDEALEAIYQNGYYAAWGETEDVFRSIKRKTFTSLLNMIPENIRGGKLLDVGAATGILMELACEWGYEPYGVEASQDGAASIARKFGAERLFADYFDQIDFAKTGLIGNFDVVTMIDLIEHVRDPNEALRQAHSLLKSDGFLLLFLPETGSLSARVLGKKWNYYAPEHLFSFSKNCIAQLLQKNGFKVYKMGASPKYLNIEYASNVLKRIPGSFGFLRPILALTPPAMKRIPIPLYVGQMTVLARKEKV